MFFSSNPVARVFSRTGLPALHQAGWIVLLFALPALAAERIFDFGAWPENQTPPGFRSAVTGKGKPGDWKVILDEVPPLLTPLNPATPVVTKRPVLAQLAQDPTDEHFQIGRAHV